MTSALSPTLDRAAWLAARRFGIGASEVAAVLGISPYASPLDVYCQKLELVPPLEESEAMRWGTRLEPLIAEAYTERTGRPLVATQVFIRHPSLPHLFATLDGVTDDDRVVEFKCIGARSAAQWGEPGTDEIPPHYLCQVHAQMLVSGLEVADVAALIGGQELRIYTVEADPDVAALMIEKLTEFWGKVERHEPPHAVRAADVRLMPALYPQAHGWVGLDEEASAMVEQYEEYGQGIKEWEEKRGVLKVRLLELLGDAATGETPDGRILTRKVIEVAEQVIARKAFRYTDLRIRKGRKF